MGKKRARQLSTSQSDCPMVEVCDICGDIGIADEILICPKCKTNREHVYCRKIYSESHTDNWCCDECEGKGTESSKDHKGSDGLFPLISDLEKCKATDAELQAENYARVPARYSSWKGRFQIFQVEGDRFGYVTPGYVAIPRARCFHRILECSKKMPELLPFKLIDRKEIWSVFFQDDSPGEDDVGLYFYSGGNTKKTRSCQYNYLMKYIDVHDLAMRCDLGEVKLYLFSSSLLPDGYKKLCDEDYFWGVFHKTKKH